MAFRLEWVEETERAVKYRMKDGSTFWLPRSLINRRTKFPAARPNPIVHEVDIPEWKAKELGLA